MVNIPYIKIPQIHIRGISSARNIYPAQDSERIVSPATPTPITYLTQWKIVGNSEVHTLPYPDIPQGYTRCKYLEFHGTEYFETGIVSKQGIGVRFRFSTTTENKWVFGVRNGATGDSSAWKSTFSFGYLTSNTMRMGYGGIASAISSVNYADGNIHTVVLDSNVAKVDDTDIPINRDVIETSYNIPVGVISTNGTRESVYFTGRIYDFVLYDEEQTLFNGIPCLDDNNVPCLYDTVSETAFYNIGTDTFGYEVEPQPTEVWSCGEYNATDGKYHILVQPLGGSIADIVLSEPLRKVNDIADTIEFPSSVEGKALVTRPFGSKILKANDFSVAGSKRFLVSNLSGCKQEAVTVVTNTLVAGLTTYSYNYIYSHYTEEGIYGVCKNGANSLCVSDPSFIVDEAMTQAFRDFIEGKEVIYELATPTTELVDVPQIEEADSYSMVISQGAKAVSWSGFETS